MKTIALFGMPYLYTSGDSEFHLKLVSLGLSRGNCILSGCKYKAILANKHEYFLTDYDDEFEFCKQFKLIATYTINDFIEEIKNINIEEINTNFVPINDYVDLKVAKLLKEIGFSDPCDRFYCDMYKNIIDTRSNLYRYKFVTYKNLESNDVLIPYLYQVQKWLRYKHNIYIYPSVYLSKDEDENCLYLVEAYKYNKNSWESFSINTIKYNTYEEALNAGILKVITKIKNNLL